MAMYRIKQEPGLSESGQLPESFPPEEYWREVKPEQARDLDLAEFAELNRMAEDEDELGEEAIPMRPFRNPWLRALVAAILIVAFLMWISADMLFANFDLGFLRRSSQLAEDEALTALRSAVVTVESSGGNGSGFNIRPDGLIVTNLHVVEGGGIITVVFNDGSVFATREYLAVDGVDMALLDIDGEGLPAVELSAAYPAEGEQLIFIGNPLGIDWTISEATARAMVLVDDVADNTPVIWFDGPVQPGSSGSPLFDSQSRVVGVVFASLADRKNSGLAIPIDTLISFLEDR